MEKLTIIIPIYNEGDNLRKVVKSLNNYLSYNNFEILLVYDESSDDTLKIAQRLMKEYNNIIFMHNPYSAGFGWSLKAGFEVVNKRYIAVMMADLCDDPKTLREMYKELDSGYDVVCGSRYMKGGRKVGGPVIKSFFSRFVGLTTHFITGLPTVDCSNAFKMYRKEVIDAISIDGSKSFAISMQMVLSAYFNNFKITEVPTVWKGRVEGESKFDSMNHGNIYFKTFLWGLGNSLKYHIIKLISSKTNTCLKEINHP